MKNKKWILIVFLLSASTLLAYGAYVLSDFQNKELVAFDFPTQKVFGHRGGNPHNSMNGIKNYFFAKHKQIEIDLFYIDGAFYLSHDLDQKIKEKEKFSETLNNLRILYPKFEKTYFWLDLKNLDEKNAEEVGQKLSALLSKHGLLKTSFVESKIPSALNILGQYKIKAVYWINPMPNTSFFYLRNMKIMQEIANTDLIAVSLPYSSYTDKVRALYKHLNVLLFTINDETEFQKFNSYPEVKIIIRD